MNKNRETQISKTMCHALRHDPNKYGLKLDPDGYVDIDLLILGIQKYVPKYEYITKNNIIYIVNNDKKGRYQLKNNYIKAVYGHSFKEKIKKLPVKPSCILYHGTTKQNANKILETGLKPMNRQYVHLSNNIETAIMVGKRRTDDPTILIIDSKNAYEGGCKFYQEPDDIWLSDYIDPQYITIK